MNSFCTLKFGLILILLIILILVLKNSFKFNQSQVSSNKISKTFTIDFIRNVFLKDNEPFQYISGSIHYSRVPEIYWYDRLLKMKAAGLNTIQIYVPWNFHEFIKGKYDFSGNKDLSKFLTIAKNLDLLVLLRSGPYMCGEWDFGGLPAWLLKVNPQMKLRSSAPDFMSAVSQWYSVLMKVIKPHLYQNNGSIIMVQVENEYGSFPSCDDAYLRALYDIVRSYLGNDIIIYSTDGNSLYYLRCGSSDRRIFSTVDFGTNSNFNPSAAFSDLEIFQPRGPLVNSEYYVGWLDSWGSKFISIDSSIVVQDLKSLYNYENSVNVNMYMFHGGTSFGFWNGANSPYTPQITSYDYDAPISEAGDTTTKYLDIRNFIKTLTPFPLPEVPPNTTKGAYGKVYLTQKLNYLTAILNDTVQIYQYPQTMEALDQYQGFMVYVCNTQSYEVEKHMSKVTYMEIEFARIGDYAYIFTGNKDNTEIIYQGALDRNMKALSIHVDVKSNLIVLIENAGHINYGGAMINDVKGIIGNVTLNGSVLINWKHFPINIKKQNLFVNTVPKTIKSVPTQAGLFSSFFYIYSTFDTFASLPSFSKGIMSINGYNLGRYWNSKGPQYTLYIPKSFLKLGLNNVTVFELEGTSCTDECYIEFIDHPILNGPVHNQQ